MRLGLIGASGHWQEYATMLRDLPEARVVAVAPGGADEAVSRFDSAAGVTAQTARYASYRDLLAAGDLDAVQVCVKPMRTATVLAECLRAGIPAMADKPLAATEAQLAEVWAAHKETGTDFSATHMFRKMRSFALAHELVRSGQAGEIVAGHCQISFRWGAARPDWFRKRETFPGTFTFIGVHAVDSAYWTVGDRFHSVTGHESTAPHPDYPACASLAYATVLLDNGGALVLSADFLRPMGATTHGDVRLRLAGTQMTLDASDRDETKLAVVDGVADVVKDAREIPFWYTTWAQHVLGQGAPFMTSREACRITELTLRIQRAIDTGDTVNLRGSITD